MARSRVQVLGVFAVVMGCGLSLSAQQSSLPKVGLTVKDIQVWVTGLFTKTSVAYDTKSFMESIPAPSPVAFTAIKAMGSAERSALVQEVLSAVKATIMAPAFRTQWTARIKEKEGAIDHGVNPDTYGLTGDAQANARWTTIVPVIQIMRTWPDDVLKKGFEDKRAELAETIKTETGDDRAKAQKDLAKLNTLVPLSKSDPAEFKKQFTLALSASMGGPDTEAALQSATAGGEDKNKIRQEQLNWNKYRLDAALKVNLTAFVSRVTAVAPKAPTLLKGTEMFEANGGEMLAFAALVHELGPAPTAVAVQFARTWLQELK